MSYINNNKYTMQRLEHSAILSTFIELKIFVLSIFKWSLKKGFAVHVFTRANELEKTRYVAILGSAHS